MFRKLVDWLVGLLFKAPVQQVIPQDEGSDDLFRPSERRIYRYFDGKDVVHADPMVLWSKLMEKAPELNIDLALARSVSKEREKGRRGAVSKVRGVFDVLPYDGGTKTGLTDAECMMLMSHFMDYMGAVKKNGQDPPTSPGETGFVSPNGSGGDTEENPPMSPTSGSGCVENGSSAGSPGPSPSGS